jgi:hypothetical protein
MSFATCTFAGSTGTLGENNERELHMGRSFTSQRCRSSEKATSETESMELGFRATLWMLSLWTFQMRAERKRWEDLTERLSSAPARGIEGTSTMLLVGGLVQRTRADSAQSVSVLRGAPLLPQAAPTS